MTDGIRVNVEHFVCKSCNRKFKYYIWNKHVEYNTLHCVECLPVEDGHEDIYCNGKYVGYKIKNKNVEIVKEFYYQVGGM